MREPNAQAFAGGLRRSESVSLQSTCRKGNRQAVASSSHLRDTTLAAARPTGRTPLLDVLAGLERGLSHSSSLVVITAAGDGEWVAALAGLRRRGVRVSVVLLDRLSFGGEGNEDAALSLLRGGVRTFSVARDVPLHVSLSQPLGVAWFAGGLQVGEDAAADRAGGRA